MLKNKIELLEKIYVNRFREYKGEEDRINKSTYLKNKFFKVKDNFIYTNGFEIYVLKESIMGYRRLFQHKILKDILVVTNTNLNDYKSIPVTNGLKNYLNQHADNGISDFILSTCIVNPLYIKNALDFTESNLIWIPNQPDYKKPVIIESAVGRVCIFQRRNKETC